MFFVFNTVFFLTLIVSISAESVSGEILEAVPPSVREVMQSVDQMHVSVGSQLGTADQRLKLLTIALGRLKTRRTILLSALRASLIDADLRLEESRMACSTMRNFNRSMLECDRLSMVEEEATNLTKVCNAARRPTSCFSTRAVGFVVLREIFEFRCLEVARQERTIETTKQVCMEVRARSEDRAMIKTAQNPVVMELRGVFIGLNYVAREIEMVENQIEAFTPGTSAEATAESVPAMMAGMTPLATVTPEPEFSPFFDVVV